MSERRSAATSLQALCEQGRALHSAGRIAEAGALYKKVLQRDPKHYDALYLTAHICANSGKAEVALPLLARAIAVEPRNFAAYSLRGDALRALHRHAEAAQSYEQAIALQPGVAEIHDGLGLALTGAERHEESLVQFEIALALNPGDANLHYDRGVALHNLTRHSEAIESFRRSLALSPRNALGHYACGMALSALNRDAEAIASLDEALGVAPDYGDALALRSFTLLRMGRFDLGWRAYECRKIRWSSEMPRLDPMRLWTGAQDVAGKILFIHHEQGLGDTLQFIRYLRRVEALGATIVLSVQNTLTELLRPLYPKVTFIAERRIPTRFDFHCALLSLPNACGAPYEPDGSEAPYVFSDPERREAIAAMLGPKSRPRIGLAWSGNPRHPNDSQRSMPFKALLPMLASDDCQWIALQNDIQPRDAEAFKACSRIESYPRAQSDFSNTACLIDLMDLVITVDTSLAHLAGAMNRPVWILLPFSAEWRWLQGRDDSPWYPSARLFRQTSIGDWTSVVDTVARRLPFLSIAPP